MTISLIMILKLFSSLLGWFFLAHKVHSWLFNFGFPVASSLQTAGGLQRDFGSVFNILRKIHFSCSYFPLLVGLLPVFVVTVKNKAGNRVMKYALEIKPAFCNINNSGRESGLLIPVISPAIWRGSTHNGDVRHGHKFLVWSQTSSWISQRYVCSFSQHFTPIWLKVQNNRELVPLSLIKT